MSAKVRAIFDRLECLRLNKTANICFAEVSRPDDSNFPPKLIPALRRRESVATEFPATHPHDDRRTLSATTVSYGTGDGCRHDTDRPRRRQSYKSVPIHLARVGKPNEFTANALRLSLCVCVVLKYV